MSTAGRESVRVARRIHVVLVDDERDDRPRVVAALREAGCRVTVAEGTADEARAVVLERMPDVVVIEIATRVGDRVDLARRLRAQERTEQIALIATSAIVEPEWPIVRFFDAYLKKPLEYPLLCDVALTLAKSGRVRAASDRPARELG